MKHAFLIMAHANYPLLSRHLRKLDHCDNTIFIHIDAKSALTDSDVAMLKNACSASSVHFIDRYKITWGGYSQINLELRLLEAAVGQKFDYYHFLSGIDFLIKPMADFHSFFEKHNGCEFVDFASEDFTRTTLGRVAQYHFFAEYCGRDTRNPLFWVEDVSLGLQRKVFRINRLKKHPEVKIQFGANWCSITHGFAEYLLSQEPKIRKLFSFSSCADEMFLQTVLLASPFAKNIFTPDSSGGTMKAHLRSTDWTRPGKQESSPYTYRVTDYEELIQSGNLICRKVSDAQPEEEALIQKLEQLGSTTL